MMPRSTHRVITAVGLSMVTMLVAAGCAPAIDSTWTPPTWPQAALAVIDGATAPLDASPGQPLAAAIAPERIRQDGVGIQARYALLPHVAGFNDAVRGYVRSVITARQDATGARYSPQVGGVGAGMAERTCTPGSTTLPAAEILANPAWAGPVVGGSSATVVCDVVWAAGTFFGERLRTVGLAADGAISDTTETFFTDTTTGEVASAAQLWTPDAAAALAGDILQGLRRAAGSLSLSPLDDPDARTRLAAALASTLPAADGGMQFTIPAGFTSAALAAIGIPPTDSARTILVPAGRAEPLLTDVGRRLLSSGGQPYAGPSVQVPGDVPVDCSLTPCVALTYDDGPSDLTPGILDALAAHRATATFFVIGQKVASHTATVQRMIADGHLVENHTWSHPSLPKLTDAQIASQLRDTTAAIEAATGQTVTLFRPPYGEYTARVLSVAGLPAILWDVDTNDWQGPADDVLIERAVNPPRPGSIVLQHDVHGNTARTVGAVCDGLLDRGFTLVNLRALFHGTLPTSGAWRSAR